MASHVKLIFKKFLFAAAIFLCALQGTAQGEKFDTIPAADTSDVKIKRNLFYFELFGNAGLYSLNYERCWITKPKFILASRVGFSFLPNGKYVNQSYLYEQNFCYGKNGIYAEFGVGYTLHRKLVASCDKQSFIEDNMHWGLLRAGIRFQSNEKGTILRIGILPVLYYADSCERSFGYVQLTGGISYGVLF